MDVLPTPAWVRPADADRWREDMLGWTTHILARLGRSATGAPRVHKLAPWSIVLRGCDHRR